MTGRNDGVEGQAEMPMQPKRGGIDRIGDMRAQLKGLHMSCTDPFVRQAIKQILAHDDQLARKEGQR